MQILIFTCSLMFIYFNYFVLKNLIKSNQETYKINNRHIRLLKLVKVAPIIAFLILLGLVLIYFHTKEEIRLSHAWYDSQFWAYATLLCFFYRITKNKLSLIFSVLSIFIAIYNTPLFHYEHLFVGSSIIVSDIFGILMFISMWLTISKINIINLNKIPDSIT
ncbi:hypothetical protein ACWV26_10220 [Rummeliibacillus sp. JY-2-4R]